MGLTRSQRGARKRWELHPSPVRVRAEIMGIKVPKKRIPQSKRDEINKAYRKRFEKLHSHTYTDEKGKVHKVKATVTKAQKGRIKLYEDALHPKEDKALGLKPGTQMLYRAHALIRRTVQPKNVRAISEDRYISTTYYKDRDFAENRLMDAIEAWGEAPSVTEIRIVDGPRFTVRVDIPNYKGKIPFYMPQGE